METREKLIDAFYEEIKDAEYSTGGGYELAIDTLKAATNCYEVLVKSGLINTRIPVSKLPPQHKIAPQYSVGCVLFGEAIIGTGWYDFEDGRWTVSNIYGNEWCPVEVLQYSLIPTL